MKNKIQIEKPLYTTVSGKTFQYASIKFQGKTRFWETLQEPHFFLIFSSQRKNFLSLPLETKGIYLSCIHKY